METGSHEKINYPRPDSVGKVTSVSLGSLEEGVASMYFFSVGLELGFEGCIDSFRLSTLRCVLGR